MVNDFVKGAAAALKRAGLPVYIDEMPMGFLRPCFAVKCVSTEVLPFLSRYFREEIKLGVEIYMPYNYDEADGSPASGRSFRFGETEAFAYEALRFIRAGERFYAAKSISAERKSQTTSGSSPSNVEGVGGIVSLNVVYARFVRREFSSDDGVMEELFENFYIDS